MDVRRLDRHRVLTLLAALAFTASLGVSAWLLLAPVPSSDGPRVLPSSVVRPAVEAATVAPLVSILSPGAVRTEVQVLGVLSGADGALALLSIDGRAADVFAPGQRLGPSTVLVRITLDAVELEQAGKRMTLPAPMLPVPEDEAVVASRRTAAP